MMKKSLDGSYHARDYSGMELELATVIYELGGSAALYALQKSVFAFPCRTTINHHLRQEYKLRITTGEPRMFDLLENIEIMFKETRPDHFRCGITLSMDEIACDARLCYLAETDNIAGLCEHSAALGSLKMGENLDVSHALCKAIKEGRVHIGQEVFVAAFARNDGKDYGARPVLIMPTCKQGTFRDPARLIEKLLQAWRLSPYGEVLHGPVWSIASDGDPKRRPALFLHCSVHSLTLQHGLWKHLGTLIGLNLFTGPNGETQDLDYKHCFKRESTRVELTERHNLI
jgi:hypothetical protein